MKYKTIIPTQPSESLIRRERLEAVLKEAGVDICQFNALSQVKQAGKIVAFPAKLSDEELVSGIEQMHVDKGIALPQAVDREFKVQQLLGNISRLKCASER